MSYKTPTNYAGKGKLAVWSKESKIFSKQANIWPGKDDTVAKVNQVLQPTSFFINVITAARVGARLDEFESKVFFDHPEAFIRNYYVHRQYGDAFFEVMPDLPAPGQPITPTKAYPLFIFDEETGKTTWKVQVKKDFAEFQDGDLFIDMSAYREYVTAMIEAHSSGIVRLVKTICRVYLASHGEGMTFSKDFYLLPFGDGAQLSQMEPQPVKDTYDPTKTIGKNLKEIEAEVQEKHKRIIKYNTHLYDTVLQDPNQEIKAPNLEIKFDHDDAQKKKFANLYLRKKASKYYLPISNKTRFQSVYSMTMAIRERISHMEKVFSPKNVFCYPTADADRTNDFSILGTAKVSDLEVILNNFDYDYISMGYTNTSALGNVTITLSDLQARGLKVYSSSVVAPGHFIIQHKNAFNIIRFFNKRIQVKADYYLLTQSLEFLFFKIHILGKCPGCVGIPEGGFIMSGIEYAENWKELSTIDDNSGP